MPSNDFVDILFTAIARQEGEYAPGPDVPKLQNNPLDLRYAGQIGASCPRCGADEGHVPSGGWCRPFGQVPKQIHAVAQFDTLAQGIAAGYRQLWADIARGDSLRALITSWAPANENNTANYLANVQKWTGITDVDAPLLNCLQLGSPLEG
jgi:hypothetical protein